jgi:hypothetical protein
MGKVRKQFILDEAKIKRVRKILKAQTDTQAVDEALNIILANQKISKIHSRLVGRLKLEDMDQSRSRE